MIGAGQPQDSLRSISHPRYRPIQTVQNFSAALWISTEPQQLRRMLGRLQSRAKLMRQPRVKRPLSLESLSSLDQAMFENASHVTEFAVPKRTGEASRNPPP